MYLAKYFEVLFGIYEVYTSCIISSHENMGHNSRVQKRTTGLVPPLGTRLRQNANIFSRKMYERHALTHPMGARQTSIRKRFAVPGIHQQVRTLATAAQRT